MVSRSFTHTPAGDVASVTRAGAPTLTYSYDARGRLSSVMSGAAQIANYAYDWREQRVAASSTEVGARHYLYAEDGQLLAEHDAQTGALIREYVWLDSMPLAMVTGPAATPSYTWITTGNLNEPLLLTNAAGQVTASTTRDPWGNPLLLVGGTPLDLGYPGQWRDPATGLSQNWHRDYDSTLGRYIEADPLGLGGGSNVFAYVGGDPVNAVDPMGLEAYNLFPYNELRLRDAADAQYRDLPSDLQNGMLHFYGHSSRNVFCIHARTGPLCLTPKQFVRWMEQNHIYKDKPIMLWGCGTGGGDNSFAKQVSFLLNDRVVVAASENTMWGRRGGYRGMRNGGIWRRFGGNR